MTLTLIHKAWWDRLTSSIGKWRFSYFEGWKQAGRKMSLFLLKLGATVLRIQRNHVMSKKIYCFQAYALMSECRYVHRRVNACGSQDRELDPLKLELQAVGNHPICFWELSPGPLQEWCMALTAGPASDSSALSHSSYYYPATWCSFHSDWCLESFCRR